MKSVETRVETEEQTTVKKKWSAPTRKKIKTGNTLSSNSAGGPGDGGGWPVAYS